VVAAFYAVHHGPWGLRRIAHHVHAQAARIAAGVLDAGLALEPEEVFDTLLPMYVSQRMRSVLLMAAASELAARQQAMHSATENAQKLIEDYTRMANNARQAEITTEITEIVSGADALKQDA